MAAVYKNIRHTAAIQFSSISHAANKKIDQKA